MRLTCIFEVTGDGDVVGGGDDNDIGQLSATIIQIGFSDWLVDSFVRRTTCY